MLVGAAGLVAAGVIATSVRLPDRRLGLLLSGTAAGAGSATVGMNGPFVAMSVSGLEPREVRPTLLAYFVPANIVTVLLWSAAGLLTWPLVATGLLGGVAAVSGVMIGARLRGRISRRWFPLVVATLCATAALRALLG